MGRSDWSADSIRVFCAFFGIAGDGNPPVIGTMAREVVAIVAWAPWPFPKALESHGYSASYAMGVRLDEPVLASQISLAIGDADG